VHQNSEHPCLDELAPAPRITLKILLALEARQREIMETKLRQKKGHGGFSRDIKADYCSDIAKNILLQYEKSRQEREVSQMVGMYPAAVSSLNEMHKPSS